jgi:hypothetical protein
LLEKEILSIWRVVVIFSIWINEANTLRLCLSRTLVDIRHQHDIDTIIILNYAIF